MSNWMPKDEYELYQRKIGEICLQMGLVEKRNKDFIEYRTELETNFVFGEVIRMFDYDEHYHNVVVFFNKLVPSNTMYCSDDYKYIFGNYHKELPFETEDNSISFSEPLEQILDKVKYIVSNAIKQRKELSVQEKIKVMKEDFK
jgi:hypothetical protein